MPDYKWQQIAPLSESDRQIDLAAMAPLYDTWRNAKERLRESSPANLNEFTNRLVRRLSIETGILERLYDLDRGTTEALVAKGFAEELISRGSTDIEPSRLIDILHDQQAAIQLVMDCVGGNRELSLGVTHELHAILTQHQDTTTAIDHAGKRFEIPLRKGAFKEQQNNPRRPDGTIHEYCPPVHVETEMENLLGWLDGYPNEDPLIVAAWFHHRFTQVHPYQDGNGRVVRALTTLILLRSDLLPLVVDRDLRADYIGALEKADIGDLGPIAALFARLQRSAIMEALSVDVDAEIVQERKLTSAVIESLAAKFNRRKAVKDADLRQVNHLAESLRRRTRTVIEQALNELKGPVAQIAQPDIHITDGGPDRDNAHWYKNEVILSGHISGKFVNFAEAHYFIKSSMRVGRERLIFVVSFHHVGRELTGIMEGTAFARLESFEDSDDRENVSQDFFPCSVEPFVVTYRTGEEEIADSFDRWLDAAVAVAIKEFGDRL